MGDKHWTPLLVEEQLAEAADVLKRLPEERVQGYFSAWPEIVRSFHETFGCHDPIMKLPWPSPASIDRMDEALGWLAWLEPLDAKLVWHRASGERWKTVCWKVGLRRSAAHQHWLYAHCLIAWRLNGLRPPRNVAQKRKVLLCRGAKT
jgi:hypothetical protein